MSAEVERQGVSPFDAIKRIDSDGEHWTGRELIGLLDYSQWRDFALVVEKAKTSLSLVQGDEAATANFAEVRKVSGSRGPSGADYRLTRFGAYLVAMAGDDTKRAVAEARVYFAVKTREAEVRPVFALPDLTTPEGQLAVAQMLVAASQKQIEQAAQIKTLQPKADYVDGFVNASSDGTLIRVLANQLGMKEKDLRGFLVEHKVIYRKLEGSRYSRSAGRNVPEYSWHAHAKYSTWFVERDQPEAPRLHNGQMQTTLYATPVGKVKVSDLVAKAGAA